MTPEELLARVDKLTEDQKAVLAEIQKSQRPGHSQPAQVIGDMGKGADRVGTGPFKSFGHLLKTVAACPNGNWHGNDLVKAWHAHAQKTLPTGLNETVGADGGVLVPPAWANRILMRTYQNPLLGMTTVLPITVGNGLRVPAVNETSRADGSRIGGVQGYWRSEAGTLTRSKPNFDTVNLQLDSLTVLVRASQELIDDAPLLESFMNMAVPMELSFKIGDALINGDGVTKPKGIRYSPSKVAVSKQTGQGAGTLTSRNINDMWSRLWVGCEENAVWLVDRSVYPALDEMTIGTASAQMAVYLPPGGLSAARYGTIKGRPVVPVEFCQPLGTEGDIILTDLSTQLTITKGGVESAVSIHLYFDTNEQAFRWVVRIDSQNWWLSALSPKSGGPTQSNILTLESRS